MASKAQALTEAAFCAELAKRLDVSKAEASTIVKAFKAEVVDCLANGYKITLTGFGRFEPQYVAPKNKDDMIRNPATGEMQKRGKNVPASFRAKAFMSRSVAASFPTIRSNAGQELATLLGANAKPRKGK